MSGWAASMADVSRALEVARGDAVFILSAALIDLGETLVATQREYTLQAQAVDTGAYLAGWESITSAPLVVTVRTDPERNGNHYAEHVHAQPKYGGPPALGFRVFEDVREELEADITAAVSARVLELFR